MTKGDESACGCRGQSYHLAPWYYIGAGHHLISSECNSSVETACTMEKRQCTNNMHLHIRRLVYNIKVVVWYKTLESNVYDGPADITEIISETFSPQTELRYSKKFLHVSVPLRMQFAWIYIFSGTVHKYKEMTFPSALRISIILSPDAYRQRLHFWMNAPIIGVTQSR